MKVSIGSKLYSVIFHKSHRGKGHRQVIDTACVISSIDDSKTGADRCTKMSVGHARQNYIDKYDKIRGKEIALARALPLFCEDDQDIFTHAFDKQFRQNKAIQQIVDGIWDDVCDRRGFDLNVLEECICEDIRAAWRRIVDKAIN